jgi:hypothetical protein
VDYSPLIRIALRYGAGAILGAQTGAALAGDPDLVSVGVMVVAAIVSAANEYWYRHARKTGGAT